MRELACYSDKTRHGINSLVDCYFYSVDSFLYVFIDSSLILGIN
jgi:hypothetical protein